jgi:hypothetical protein
MSFELFAFSLQAMLSIPYVRLLRVQTDGKWIWTLEATVFAVVNIVVSCVLVYGFLHINHHMKALAEGIDCRYYGYPSWLFCTFVMFALMKFSKDQATAWKICTFVNVLLEVSFRMYFVNVVENENASQ